MQKLGELNHVVISFLLLTGRENRRLYYTKLLITYQLFHQYGNILFDYSLVKLLIKVESKVKSE